MVDPQGPTPAYVQVADALEARIKTGEWAPDTRIMSEKDIQQTYGVARGTARHAIEALRERGLVYTVAQRGTYVKG